MMASAWGIVITGVKQDGFGPGVDPCFLTLGSKPVLMHALSAFERCADIENLVVLVPKERVDGVRAMVQMFGCYKAKQILPLTGSRTASVQALLKDLGSNKVPVVTIHEGIRPLLAPEEISETIKLAKKFGAASLGDRVTDPIHVTAKGTKVVASPQEGVAWACRTPQSFKVELLARALAAAQKKKLILRDECDALPLVKAELHVAPSHHPAVRISGPRDLVWADHLLRQ